MGAACSAPDSSTVEAPHAPNHDRPSPQAKSQSIKITESVFARNFKFAEEEWDEVRAAIRQMNVNKRQVFAEVAAFEDIWEDEYSEELQAKYDVWAEKMQKIFDIQAKAYRLANNLEEPEEEEYYEGEDYECDEDDEDDEEGDEEAEEECEEEEEEEGYDEEEEDVDEEEESKKDKKQSKKDSKKDAKKDFKKDSKTDAKKDSKKDAKKNDKKEIKKDEKKENVIHTQDLLNQSTTKI
jgi:cobalamin biosynthesis protein CobT